MRVAMLGMGRMGRALASRLLDTGHEVTVWNRTESRATPLLHRGATWAPTPADAAAQADDAVLSSLADDTAVKAVLMGPNGATAGLKDNAVLVDHSTVAPETSREVAAATPGGRFLAVPIAGGPPQVEQGQATLFVGGPRQWVDRLELLLTDLAGGYLYCGEDPGAASTVKLLNNYLLMAGVAILGEVVAAAEAVGLDSQVLTSYLTSSPLVAPALKNRLDNLMAHGEHAGWFSTTLGAKDVMLAIKLAGEAGLDWPIARAVADRYQAAIEADLADQDIAAVVEVARRPRS